MQEVSWKKKLPRRDRKSIGIVFMERVQRVLDKGLRLIATAVPGRATDSPGDRSTCRGKSKAKRNVA